MAMWGSDGVLAPVSYQHQHCPIAEMVLNQGDLDNNEDEDDINTAEKVPIENMVKMCDGLIEGLEQRAFITEQEIMSIYKIKETSTTKTLVNKPDDSGRNI